MASNLLRLAGVCRSLSLVAALSLGCDGRPASDASVEPGPGGSEPTLLTEAPAASEPEPVCKARTPRGGPLLIPDGVEWLIHVAPAELVHSQLWVSFAPALEANEIFANIQTTLDLCGVGLGAIEHVLLGMRTSEDSSGALVITGPGVGRPELAACVVANTEALSGQLDGLPASPTPLPDDAQVQTLALGDGDTMYLLDPDMLVVSGASFGPEIVALSRCQGFPAIEHGLAELVRRVDTGAPLWLAGQLPADAARDFETALNLEPGSIRDLIVSARVENGLDIGARLGTASPHFASTAQSMIESFVPMLRGLAPPSLIPALDRIEISTLGADVTIRAALSDTELAELGAMIPP